MEAPAKQHSGALQFRHRRVQKHLCAAQPQPYPRLQEHLPRYVWIHSRAAVIRIPRARMPPSAPHQTTKKHHNNGAGSAERETVEEVDPATEASEYRLSLTVTTEGVEVQLAGRGRVTLDMSIRGATVRLECNSTGRPGEDYDTPSPRRHWRGRGA